MQEMISFMGALMSLIPEFLMAEPICYLVSMLIMGFLTTLFIRLISIGRRY